MFVTFGTLANVTLLDGGFFYSNTFNPGHPNVLRAIVSVSFVHLTLYLAWRRRWEVARSSWHYKKTPLNPKHRRHMYEYFVLPSCTNALRSCFQNYASIMGWKGSWVDCGTVYRSGFVFQRCLQTIIKATAFFLPSRMPCVCLHILLCLQSLLLAAHLHD